MYQKKKFKILVIDDDAAILASLQMLLEAEYEMVDIAQSIEHSMQLLAENQYHLVLMDMNYSPGATNGMEGVSLLKEMKANYEDLPIVVMTAYSELSLAVECIKLGASDFIQKPWSNNRLLLTLENVLKYQTQKKELTKYKLNVKSITSESEQQNLGMIGNSNAMKLVREKILKIGNTNANVLILGENGTGKELVAKAIHQISDRREQPFVKIDLGTIHNELFESELFGAKKGAYTGLNSDKTGRIAMANEGSLFLDELGNVELAMQSKLLSVLQNRQLTPVGDTKSQEIDVRLISATNLPISELLNESVFRQDLLYRVNTIEIQLPPLRERAEDIDELMNHFLSRFIKKYNMDGIRFSANAKKAAKRHHWLGNIRELEHSVERAVLMCAKGVIEPEDMISMRYEVPKLKKKSLNIEAMEKQLIEEALRVNSGNMTKAALDLGITRTALYRRLEKFGL